jgi:predicted peptidase
MRQLSLGILGIMISCSAPKFMGLAGKTFVSDEKKNLPYNIYYPDEYYQQNTKLPVLLWLHGAGERGDDNVSQLIHIVPYLASDMVQSKFPSIIIAPQCPKEDYWAPVKRGEWTPVNQGQVTPAMEQVIQLMEQVLKDPKIDQSRIYVGGLSMGGFGTYDILSRKPEWFAAAIPICGGADLTKVSIIKNIPLWIFHGAKDEVVTPELSRNLVKELQKLGVNPKYTEYENGGHDVWNRAVREPELLKWLFAQKAN